MAFKVSWVCNAILLLIFRSRASGLTCFVDLIPDPSKDGEMRWGLLIDKDQRCDCTKIIAKPTGYSHPHFAVSCNKIINGRWFTDTPGLLTDLHVWDTEKLKFLLNCSYTDHDECIANSCVNGATCVDELFDYRCACTDGYEGPHCEIDLNECSSSPCKNGGACVDGVNGYNCTCLPGYIGVHCEVAIECYTETNGADYRGTVSTTTNGKTCQNWTSQTPHDHGVSTVSYPNHGIGDHNYCRNPDGVAGAWCYTTDVDDRWGYCDIGIPQTSCIDYECSTQTNGADYRGTVSTTSNGKTCQKWTSQTPHDHGVSTVSYPNHGIGDHNYCRNPDGVAGAWCYTTDVDDRWGYCDIGIPQTSCIEA